MDLKFLTKSRYPNGEVVYTVYDLDRPLEFNADSERPAFAQVADVSSLRGLMVLDDEISEEALKLRLCIIVIKYLDMLTKGSASPINL